MDGSQMAVRPATSGSRRPFSYSGTTSRPTTSRFVEGSMNDRTSAPPPPSFLGPETSWGMSAGGDAPTRPNLTRHSMQSFGTKSTSSGTATTTTTSSNSSRRPTSFLAPLWNTWRRLHRRSRTNINTQAAAAAAAAAAQREAAAAAAAAMSADRPSPDDVLANYQQLMQSGFFRARAIPATRQGLASRGGGGSQPRPASPKPMPEMMAEAAAVASSGIGRRGTKRGHADVEDTDTGSERTSQDSAPDGQTTIVVQAAAAAAATPAGDGASHTHHGKLVKKLRKSASQLREDAEHPRAVVPARRVVSMPRRRHHNEDQYEVVDVHQTVPPVPVLHQSAMSTTASPASPRRLVSNRYRRQAERRRQYHMAEQPSDDRSRDDRYRDDRYRIERRSTRSMTAQRKTRSAAAAAAAADVAAAMAEVVVHQDEDEPPRQKQQQQQQQQQQQTLPVRPLKHAQRPLGQLAQSPNPTALSPPSSSSPLLSSPPAKVASPSPSSPPPPPISFHYPQRVRMQVVQPARERRTVEVVRATRSSARARAEGGGEPGRKPRRAMDVEDVENCVPAWAE